MSRQLTVHNAQITTATVEIKTLTISGKQVTLAVFRQLREQPLISGDGELLGQPWGTVNYHPDKCAGLREHLHVVWQDGDTLYRALAMRPSWWTTPFYSEGSDELIQAMYCLNRHNRLPGWQRATVDGGRCIRFTLDDMPCETAIEPKWQQGHKCMTEEDRDVHLKWVTEDVAAERERRKRISDFTSKVTRFADERYSNVEEWLHFERLAVTEQQIAEWQLPTRPTKRTDTRSAQFRGESVEVDAIPAALLRQIVRDAIEQHIDPEALRLTQLAEQSERDILTSMRHQR
jgi:hypothetical protein